MVTQFETFVKLMERWFPASNFMLGKTYRHYLSYSFFTHRKKLAQKFRINANKKEAPLLQFSRKKCVQTCKSPIVQLNGLAFVMTKRKI